MRKENTEKKKKKIKQTSSPLFIVKCIIPDSMRLKKPLAE